MELYEWHINDIWKYIEYVLCIFEIVRNARTTTSKQSFKGANVINRKSYNLPVAINRFQWVVLIPFDRVTPYNLFLFSNCLLDLSQHCEADFVYVWLDAFQMQRNREEKKKTLRWRSRPYTGILFHYDAVDTYNAFFFKFSKAGFSPLHNW